METLIAGRAETTTVATAEAGFAVDVVTGKPCYPNVFHLVSSASLNTNVIKASKGSYFGVVLSNQTGQSKFVKLYDKATAPVPGTDIPKMVFGIPANWSREVMIAPVAFQNGLGIAITGGVADTDATPVGSGDVAVDVLYL